MAICIRNSGSKSGLVASLRIAMCARPALMVMALAGVAALAWGSPALAGAHQRAAHAASDPSVEALRQFASEVGIAPTRATPAASSAGHDQTYSALLDFARLVGAAPDATAIKTAATDTDVIQLAQAQLAQAQPAKPAPVKRAAVKPAAKPAAKKENKGGEGDAYFVGSAKCATCHAEVTAEFSLTQMGRIGRTTRKGTMECENCHGPGSKHVAAGGGQNEGMIAYRPNDPRYNVEEINETCLTCHEKDARTAWKGSTHETRGLACTNCHTVMRNVSPKNLLSAGAEGEVCFQCHKQSRAQMQRSSHMPVREGKMTCSDCHNAHGSVKGTEAMLREASVNDNCYKCHAEKRGPVLWSHAPVVENCLNCHDAHGSNHENMLKVARPRLCNECHTVVHSPGNSGGLGLNNTPYTLGRSCGNCHSQIHGSNHPAGAYFLR